MENVTVYATDKAKFLVSGKAYEVSIQLGETLVKKGAAVYKLKEKKEK